LSRVTSVAHMHAMSTFPDGLMSARRRRCAACVLCAVFTWGLPGVDGSDTGEGLDDHVEYVWPLVLMQIPLPRSAGETQAEVDSLLHGLADIGEKGFSKYLKEVLPIELEADDDFARAFNGSDESRWNDGFFRWQKRTYSKLSKISVEEILWDGKPVPALPGVKYKWDELHRSDAMKRILPKLAGQLETYQQHSDATLNRKEVRKGRFIPWVQVFRPGAFHRPMAHTGSPVVGFLVLRCAKSQQRVIFEDPRGINPPFGRKHAIALKEGDLFLFPSWASHFFDPNRGKETHVILKFAVQGPGGPRDFDWEDDGTGSIVKKVLKKIRAKRSGPSSEKAPPKTLPKAAPTRAERSEL